MEPVDLFVGLGSNIEPAANVPRMLSSLLGLVPSLDVSPIAVTEPVDIDGGGGQFLNLAVRLRTSRPVPEVKAFCNSVEVALGRDRTDPERKHHNRTADLDILFAVPVGAAELPASVVLPTEAYLRPQVDALLRYVGLAVPGTGEADPMAGLRTVQIEVQGVAVGPTCTTVRHQLDDTAERT